MGSVTTARTPSEGVMVRESGYGKRRSVRIILKDYKAEFVDAAGTVAYFTKAMCVLPEALVDLDGCVVKIDAKTDGGDGTTTGIFAAFDGDIGIGTAAAAADATLSSTEQDIVPTTATTQAVSGATTMTAKTASRVGLLDGTATPKTIYLNILVDDTDHNVAGAAKSGLILNGYIDFNFNIIGDV